MNSKEIFQIALGLQKPWYVKSVTIKETTESESISKELHIEIAFEKGSSFPSNDKSDTGKYKVHDTVERTWRHLNFFEHKCYLSCKVPRTKAKSGTQRVQVP